MSPFGESFALRLFGPCLLVVLAPSACLADWRDFMPTPVDNGAWVDVFSTWERDRSRAGRSIEWTDTFIKEKLTLGSLGYSYHPKFLQYRFSVGGVLSQENYESSFQRDRGWHQRAGPEYETRLTLLPEHFYNLLVFATRYEPMFRERAAAQVDQVENRRGARFRYRKKPYFVGANFVNQENDYGATSSDVNQLALDGKYFLRTKAGNELSFNGGFNPSWFSNSNGLDGSSKEYVLGNAVAVKRVRLTSSVVKRTFDQQQSFPAQDFETDQFSVYELLNAFLPWSFRGDASYRFRDNDTTIDDRTTSRSERLTDRGNEVRGNLVHRLYESLDTGAHYERDERRSLGGETISDFQSVDVNYTKLIPWGRFLTGVNLGTGDTENRGRTDVIDETHAAALVPGSFRLQQPNVDRASIALFMKSPLPPFELVPLVENVHYAVLPSENSFEIQLLTLPARFVVPESYDFLVSYSLLGGEFDLRTNTLAHNASVELFDNQVTPYFGYALVRSDVESGTFPASLVDTTTYTTGLLLRRGPLRARGEYQELEWEVSPYRSWRAELQYVSPVSRTTNVHAALTYLNRYYRRGISLTDRTAFTDETETASGGLQQQLFFLERLSLNVGGSYSRLDGLLDGEAFSANGSLSWATGQLELLLGVTAYASETSGRTTFRTRRENQYVYFHLRRRLL